MREQVVGLKESSSETMLVRERKRELKAELSTSWTSWWLCSLLSCCSHSRPTPYALLCEGNHVSTSPFGSCFLLGCVHEGARGRTLNVEEQRLVPVSSLLLHSWNLTDFTSSEVPVPAVRFLLTRDRSTRASTK